MDRKALDMNGGGNVIDFYQRFQQLQLQRDTSDELIKDLLIYTERTETALRLENETLRSQIADANLDIADATKSRRDLQQRVAELERQMGHMSSANDHLKNWNPYIVILIDGDGCHFQPQFIEKGLEGGKQAAYALRNAILKECRNHSGDIEIHARYIANLSGLAMITRASGTVDSEFLFKQFTVGFTTGMASFDFIDVGKGKERADTKIKEGIRWHLRNHNCRQIVCAISADSGYASFLEDMLRDESARHRITILEGPPTHPDLVATGLHIMNLNREIFRSDKLVLENYRRQSDATPLAITPPATVAGMSPLPPPSATPVSQQSNGGAVLPPSSYATAIKAATPPPQVTLPFQPKPKTPAATRREKVPAWNPGPRGLDAPLEVNQSALDNIKKRKDNNKLCNNHYLRGPCAKGDACCFEHKYRPNEAEKTAIAFLARLNPCTNGQDCEVEDCIYGHHCPSTRDGQCTHPYCKFKPWEHPPNTKFRATYQWLDEE